MRFTIHTKAIQTSTKLLRSVVDRKSIFGSIRGVLMQVPYPGTLLLTATDCDTTVTVMHGIEGGAVGQALVNECLLTEAVKSVDKGVLSLEMSTDSILDPWLQIQEGAATRGLATSDPESFPTHPLPAVELVEVNAGLFKGILDRLLPCVSTNPSRRNLGGVYLHRTTDGGLRLVATDGDRLSLSDGLCGMGIPVDPIPEFFPGTREGAIIPPKVLRVIQQVLRTYKGPTVLRLGVAAGMALFQVGGVVVVARLIEGPFPTYEAILADRPAQEKEILVEREPLIAGVKKIRDIADDQNRGIRLTFTRGVPGRLTLETTLSTNRLSLTIPVQYEREPTHVAVDSRYLWDALSVCGSREVGIGLGDPSALAPVYIRPMDAPRWRELYGALHLIMPLHD